MQVFRELLFLLLLTTALPCKASDSIINQLHCSKIIFKKYQTYQVQINSSYRLALFRTVQIEPAIKIPGNPQPFIAPEAVQAVCHASVEKRKAAFFNHKSIPGHQLFFLKGSNSAGNHRYEEEEWGLLRNENATFWKKAGRGEKFIGGAELLGMGVLMMMPKELTKWKKGWLAEAGSNIKRAFSTMPVVDKDHWQLNYVGHPLAGALYFNAIRSQNATWFQSFLFSTAQSAIWEYVIEGIAEPPSIQDLIVTPVAGAFLGEAFHQITLHMRKNGFSFVEKVVTLILNPMFVINNGYGPKHNPAFTK